MSKRDTERAQRHRDQLIETARRLNDSLLADLNRKGRFTTTADGYPARTLPDGTSRSTSQLTSVEAAAVARIEDHQHHDNVGEAIRDVFGLLTEMAGIAKTVDRKLDFITHVSSKAVGRQSSTAGGCQCCNRDVAGTENDRMRSGYCEACYKAWNRDGRPERPAWEEARRVELRPAESA